MASILSLNDDCLCAIVSYLVDRRSFYSIALTCKRLLQVTKRTKIVLHSNLLHAKAEFYIKSFIVDIISAGKVTEECEEYCKLTDLLDGAVRLAQIEEIRTYTRVLDAWERNGPVAATLLTWMKNQKSSKEYGNPQPTCVTEDNSVVFHLPGCGKNMLINAAFFYDPSQINRDPALYIHVNCGELDVETEAVTRDFYSQSFSAVPVDYMNWKGEEMSAVMKPLNAMMDILQTELGETIPPITNHFFFWLCFFFPDKQTLSEEQKLHFKEANRNGKPTPAFVQAATDLFRHQAGTKFQNLASEWKNDERLNAQSSCTNMILEAIDLLAHRSETKLLKSLDGDVVKFFYIMSDHLLVLLPKMFLLDLVQRTSLGGCSYTGMSGSVTAKSSVCFRCFGLREVMKVTGSMHGRGAGSRPWKDLELEFTLPDSKMLNVHFKFNLRANKKALAIKHLSPVTKLLQQSINQSMEGEKCSPKIGNLFTAIYFLHALEFDGAPEIFLGGIKEQIHME